MNKTFIASLENHDVYYISTNNIAFYFNISKNREPSNISLDINYKHRNTISGIINYYEKIDNYNVILVIPAFRLEENANFFKEQGNLLSFVINCSYKFLTFNGVKINSEINLIKHDNSGEFEAFFLNKFASRVRYISLEDLVGNEVPYNKVDTANNMSFVVGKPDLELTLTDNDMKCAIEDVLLRQGETLSTNKNRKASFATSGYVSYYLLGFLTAIITLLVLTMLVR